MSNTLTKPRAKKTSGTAHVHREKKRWTGTKLSSGVVGFYVNGAAGKIAGKTFTPSNVIEVLKVGLPVKELTDLQTSLAVPTERLAPMLGISKATFHRRKGAGERLGAVESDRVVRFARLLGQAIKVLGGDEDARQWLSSAQFGLGGAVPLDYAKTEVGAREVENLLGRIEHGVYS
jgi:putative toxin-antitoxin system antitoxin component (TIGR02293 family)